MQKRSLEMCCYVACTGAFGVFFRWLQNMLAFDEQGLNEKSAFNVLVPLLIIGAAIMFRRMADGLKRQKLYVPEEFTEALFNPGKPFALARWVAGGIMFLGAAVLVLTTETDPDAELLRALAVLAAGSGIAFPLVLGSANYDEFANAPLVRFGMLLPVFTFAFWLVLSYKQNSYNSVAWSYAVEMFVLMVDMLAFFRMAGFSFGVVNERKSLTYSMMAGAMSIMVIADNRYIGMQMIFFAAALMMLVYIWVLALNLKKKGSSADEQSSAGNDGFEKVR